MIKIVYACNDAYFDCLYLSILSIVRRCKDEMCFYVLSADYTELNEKYKIISKKHEHIIDKMVKKYNPKNTFKVINCTKQAKKNFKLQSNVNNKKFSPYTNLRLLIHLFNEFDKKVIYLDTDTMACGNIRRLHNIKIQNNEIAVCHNWWLRNTFAKNSFNSGVILFNMQKIRETKLLEKAINILNKTRMVWPDQTALVRASSRVVFFPKDEYRFNRQSEKIKNGDIIKHFCSRPWGWPFWNNIKQCDIKNVHKHLKIFEFDEDYKIWLKEKSKW